ncbi:MAG: WxL protein peptidoglycan domain-containing protein [Thermomicrobiales bacterium]
MGNRGNGRRGPLLAIIVPFMLLLGLMISVSAVRADDAAPQFGIRPANPTPETSTGGYFTLKAQAGETLKDSVLVANPGTVPVTLLLYAVDATSGQNGGAVYLNNDDPRKDVGSWITLEQTTVDVPPQKQTTVNFTMNLPKETRSGQHLGGIVAQLVQGGNATALAPGQQSAGFGITTVTRALTAMLVDVGGQPSAPSLKITGAQIAEVDGLPTLTLSIQNDGNALVKPQGAVTVLDAAGKTVMSNPLALDTLVPQSTIAYPVQADPPTTPGTYKVHATLDFGGSAPTVFDGPITVTAKPTATPVVSGRARATPQANAPVANAPSAGAVITNADTATGGSSPLIPILGGVIGVFAILTVGLGVFIARSRKQQPR